MPGKAEEKCFNFVYVVKLLRYSSNLVLGQFVNQLKHIIRLEWRKKVHKTTIFLFVTNFRCINPQRQSRYRYWKLLFKAINYSINEERLTQLFLIFHRPRELDGFWFNVYLKEFNLIRLTKKVRRDKKLRPPSSEIILTNLMNIFVGRA